MTEGDILRGIEKDLLFKNIKQIESLVREIRNSDGESSENDIDIKAYRQLIKTKRIELERM